MSNFFIVNPQVASGTYVMSNGINTLFNALQIELRPRLANGLLVQGSYQFGQGAVELVQLLGLGIQQSENVAQAGPRQGPVGLGR